MTHGIAAGEPGDGRTPPQFRFPPPAPAAAPAEAPLRFITPAGHPHEQALERGAQWLLDRVVTIGVGDEPVPLSLIAWWDPTLSSDRRDLVAYTITDTLWAAWALRPFAPTTAAALGRSLDRLGCRSNGFMDQPFHVLDEFRLHNTDSDPVHGSVILSAYAAASKRADDPTTAPRRVDVRAMGFRTAPEQENLDFAATFVDPAVYYAFHLYWNGDRDGARAVLLRCLDPDAGIPIHYDHELGLLLDAADQQGHEAMVNGERPYMLYAPFKQALFLMAARQMNLVGNGVPPAVAARLEQRVVEAQNLAGGFRHLVPVDDQGNRVGPIPDWGGTGETTAICILTLLSPRRSIPEEDKTE
jgi:hypothetical protein